MAMLPGGTFDYVAVVPGDVDDGLFTCQASCREPVAETGVRHAGDQLVGLAPMLTVIDAGVPPSTDFGRPWVSRSQLTLEATSEERATAAAAACWVDRALTRRMRPGDVIHLVRTHAFALALSIVRKGELVAAVGAVTQVPLGDRLRATRPMDLADEAIAVFKRKDPTFRLEQEPIEVTLGQATALVDAGSRTLGEYEVFVERGFNRKIGLGFSGTNESAAIWREDLCPAVAARSSMSLLAMGSGGSQLAITHW